MKTRRLLSLLLLLAMSVSPSMTALAGSGGMEAALYQQEAAAVDIPEKSSETVELHGMEASFNEVQKAENYSEGVQKSENTSEEAQQSGKTSKEDSGQEELSGGGRKPICNG